jgi:predicted transcriptional regulator
MPRRLPLLNPNETKIMLVLRREKRARGHQIVEYSRLSRGSVGTTLLRMRAKALIQHEGDGYQRHWSLSPYGNTILDNHLSIRKMLLEDGDEETPRARSPQNPTRARQAQDR